MANPNPLRENLRPPWKKGESGNLKGRPKFSITTLVKEELQKVPEGQKQTYAQILVKRIMSKAITDGDINAIKQIWQYMDGMPMQRIEGEIETSPDINFIVAQIIRADDGTKQTIKRAIEQSESKKI